MKKFLFFISLATLALSVASCSPSNTESSSAPTNTTNPASPTNPPTPTPAPAATTTPSQENKTQPPTPKVSGLMPSTNPEKRREIVGKGREDPFSPLETPLQRNPNTEAELASTKKPSSVPTPPKPQVVQQKPTQQQPQADLAEQVIVTGLVSLGDVTQIIVQSPGENFPRYVKTGQYLANGEVLVKRIEMNPGSAPMVVLEQSGIEVVKPVGAETEV